MNNKFSHSTDIPDFRDLMEGWEYFLEVKKQEDRLNELLDKHQITLFFTKGKDLFGAPESSRVIFAKLKTNDEDDPMQPNFRQEARFPAINLFRSMSGDPDEAVQSVFGLKDLPKLKVCDREDAVKMLMTNKCKD